MNIKLLITGGTIDKEYDLINATLIFTQSHIKDLLTQARCKVDIDLETIILKDSLDITDIDRQEILKRCKNCEEDKIIVSHGTDTMQQTAKILAHEIKNRTIVLVGSMIPYMLKYSDALFNMGAAITAVQLLDNGVYITMNGKVFKWDKVRKNKELGEFEEID